MRALNKTIIFGIILISFILTSSSFPDFKDTYASFIDTKYVNANFTTGTWDIRAGLAGLYDSKIPENSTKLKGNNQDANGNTNKTVTDNDSSDPNSSNSRSSASNLKNNSSATGNFASNTTADNKTTDNMTNNTYSGNDSGMGGGSSGSTVSPEQLSDVLPVANFSSSIVYGYVPLYIQFKDLSENAEKWNWDFGDGNTSTEQNPEHSYFISGNYTVKQVVSNANGTNFKLALINVFEKPESILSPVAKFHISATNGFAPFFVQFTDLSENASRWMWDFGDGNTSTMQSPEHTYSTAGNYTVNLTVNNTNGANSTSSKITVLQPILPIPNFSSNVTYGYAPLSVQFTALSNFTTEWNWDFGDGSVSTGWSPEHTYFTVGNYTVNLTVDNENGTDSKLATINVFKQPAAILPVSNFSINITAGYVPQTVRFSDLSKNATKWNWDFGDGTDSTEQSPEHTYSAAGTYTINLTVANSNGTNSTSSKISVLQPILPISNFSSDVTSGFAPLSVQFTDLSENATKWNWDFGNGNVSIEQNPVYIYNKAGNYTVTLKVSNKNGQSEKTNLISVYKKSDGSDDVNPSNNSRNGDFSVE